MKNIKPFLNALKWEMILTFKERMRHKKILVIDLLIFTWTFIVVYYFDVSEAFMNVYGVDNTQAKILIIIGYIFWQSSSAAVGYCEGTVSTETAYGIFEIRLQSIFSMEIIWFCRLIVETLIHVVTYIGIFAFGSFVIGFTGRDIAVFGISILCSFIAVTGMYGMGMIFGSFSVIEKDLGQFVTIFETILLLVSNVLSPFQGYWMYIFPFAPGIDICRNIYLGLPVQPTLVLIYILVNIIWFTIGCVCYRMAVKHEKRYGSFEKY